MNANTKARAIKALLEAAAEIAGDLANETADAASTRGATAELNQMVGQALHFEAMAQQIVETCQAIKALQNVAVAS